MRARAEHIFEDTVIVMVRTTVLVAFLFLSFATAATPEGMVTAETQKVIDEGLDAVKAKNWDLAIKRFSAAIEAEARLFTWHGKEEGYAQFAARFPAYVFRNLALAADAKGADLLDTAAYWRAYLAYDSNAEGRLQIEKRIGELERLHKSFVSPLCEASLARHAGFATWCLTALVLIGDPTGAGKLENRLRPTLYGRVKGYGDCADPIVIDEAYAEAYSTLDLEQQAGKYASNVAAATPRNAATECQGFQRQREEIAKKLDALSEQGQRRRKYFAEQRSGGRVASAIEWASFTWGIPTNVFGKYCESVTQEGLPDPLSDLPGYLKFKDQYDRAAVAREVLPGDSIQPRIDAHIAEHNACAAFMLAYHWAHYQWKVKYWARHLSH